MGTVPYWVDGDSSEGTPTFQEHNLAVTYTFTNAGATGREGPTQSEINSAYLGTNLESKVTINTRGVQEWTVPASGTYRIEAWGASGGNSGSNGNGNGGHGAKVNGNFTLQKNSILRLIIGQQGLSAPYEAGGGGGTFIFFNVTDTFPLLVAGGGGGGGKSSDGKNAEVTNNGSSGEGSNFGTGGNNGLGGSKGSHSTYAAAGGGGWLTDGEDGVDGRDPTYMDGSGGLSPRNGATGGNNRTQHNPLGGFGGGGAGRGHNYAGAGGGGGYSGGGAGAQSGGYGGGGGGSYNSGTDPANTIRSDHGHGKVIVTFLAPLSYTFTNAGATGREGPTQSNIDSAYLGTNLESKVTINTRGIQEWTVPASGTYKIEVLGASGGNQGGYGSRMIGSFNFSFNEVLSIAVGQEGLSNASYPDASAGGGGTFVVQNSTPLIVAGGGGGGVRSTLVDAGTTSSGNNDSDTSAQNSGGTNGNGGSANGRWGGAGGGGFSGDGGNGKQSDNIMTNSGGRNWAGGLVGGIGGGNYGRDGGFGGGGASSWASGGGGGYSGGAGKYSEGHSNERKSGGGGGSFNSGADQSNTAGVNNGHGKVIITLLSSSDSNDQQVVPFIFTNANAVGREGPTQSQIDDNYSGTNLENKITVNTRGFQEWAVPESGQYKIEVWGASGGSSTYGTGGKGAFMSGKFILEESQLLKIIAGQTGIGNSNGAGGGGGSFVVNGVDSTLLIAAGGGGGAGGYLETTINPHLQDGKDAVSGTSGTDAQTQGPGAGFTSLGQGGSSGSGGTGGVSNHPGAGGAGFLTDGTMGTNTAGYHAFSGVSFSSGFIGGDGRGKPNGGFGGGGSTSHGGGGGGGYSGGGGGVLDSSWWCRLGSWRRWRWFIQLRIRSK